VVASVGTLGMLIPPSLVLIIYGIVVQQSIGRLFLAGILPGLLISLFFIFVIYGWAKSKPDIAPRGEKASWHERLRALPEILWVGIVFFIVIGGMMYGFFSPTEAGTMGTVGFWSSPLSEENWVSRDSLNPSMSPSERPVWFFY